MWNRKTHNWKSLPRCLRFGSCSWSFRVLLVCCWVKNYSWYLTNRFSHLFFYLWSLCCKKINFESVETTRSGQLLRKPALKLVDCLFSMGKVWSSPLYESFCILGVKCFSWATSFREEEGGRQCNYVGLAGQPSTAKVRSKAELCLCSASISC